MSKKAVIDKDEVVTSNKPLKWPKEELFCQEYIIDFNATQAYKRAGYKPKNDRVSCILAMRLLAKDRVHARLQYLVEQRNTRIMIDQMYVVEGFKEIADRCMQRVPVMYWDKDKKEFVQETAMVEDPDTGEKSMEGIWKFDAKNANEAFKNLSKHTGGFADKVQISGANGQPLPTGIAGLPDAVLQERVMKLEKAITGVKDEKI